MRFLHRLPPGRLVSSRDDLLVSKAKGRRVLHLGAVDTGLLDDRMASHSWLHAKLEQAAQAIIGIDKNRDGIRWWTERGVSTLAYGDVEAKDGLDLAFRYDVVIAADIIEHLANPGLFLENIHRVMPESAELVISTPNGLCWKNLGATLLGIEITHPDHNFLFTPHTLCTLLRKHGFVAEEIVLYAIGFVPSPASHPNRLTRAMLSVVSVADTVVQHTVVPRAPFLADGMCITARKVNR